MYKNAHSQLSFFVWISFTRKDFICKVSEKTLKPVPKYCWDPGSYTAFSFAFVPTGDADLMLIYLIYAYFVCFFLYKYFTYNNDCTAKTGKKLLRYVLCLKSYVIHRLWS